VCVIRSLPETWRIDSGDCIAAMRELPEASIDAIVTDPPYEIGFMGRSWDSTGIAYDPATWAECLRVLKPGGHLLAFAATRTYHRIAVAIEDGGFAIRDMVAWIYGTGFPKSLDVAKAIGKRDGGRGGDWQGWGTALKPAHEPIVVARKPLDGTVAANVLAHGTGALNIDANRIGSGSGGTRDGESSAERRYSDRGATNFAPTPGPRGGDARGRWPANVILGEDAAADLDDTVGERGKSTGTRGRGGDVYADGAGYANTLAEVGQSVGYGDSGGPSRFFYVAKPSRRERDAGLDAFDSSTVAITDGHGRGEINTSSGKPRENRPRKNVHPTVKPIDLMRHLCRLVTPPNGLVLDPFAGSGSTGCGAVLDGFRFLGLELLDDHAEIARARIAHRAQPEATDATRQPTARPAARRPRRHGDLRRRR
jgi:DNA modification methylase